MITPNIRIASWNIKDGLSDADRAPMLIAAIEREDPTAAVLCEAYDAIRPGSLDNALEDLEKRDYVVQFVDQERFPERPDAHGLVVITKRESTVSTTKIALAGRYALQAVLRDEASGRDYQFIGHHGNDINEAMRVDDSLALGPWITMPTIYAGDHNSMKPKGITPRLLRAAGPFVRMLPSERPDPENPPKGIKRVASLGQRLSEMAIGDAWEIIHSYGLRDADYDNIATMSEKGVSVKLDHIYVSSDFYVASHSVHTRNAAEEAGLYKPASDHRAISAVLGLTA